MVEGTYEEQKRFFQGRVGEHGTLHITGLLTRDEKLWRTADTRVSLTDEDNCSGILILSSVWILCSSR